MAPTTSLAEAAESRFVTDDEPLYEVEDGRVVELPPMGAYEVEIASALLEYLRHHGRTKRLGRAVAEMLFDLRAIGRQRRPDVAFVSYKRWPSGHRVPSTPAWAVSPDLAVEVVSPSNPADKVLRKVGEYFRAGVRLVWIIFPEAAQLHVYESPKQIRVLDSSDVLRGEPVLPGFRLPLTALFETEKKGKRASRI